MALQKNKMAVEDDTYEIAQAHDAQFKANSEDKDTGKSITWTESEPLENEEINSNIFNKMSKMFSNVRYLYNELGGSGTITGSSTSIKKKLDDLTTGKANKYHEHITNAKSQLPIINTNENSKVYVPSSQLLNALNVDLFSKVKTKIDIEVYPAYEQYISNPNNRAPVKINETYVGNNLGVWSSVSDVDKFCNNHNSANGYAGLSLGDYVTIQDGVFNAQWMIAGFDTEANNGSNNGVGICMIPRFVLGTYVSSFGESYSMYYTPSSRSNGEYLYYNAPMYYKTNLYLLDGKIGTSLYKILSTHLVNRNVLYPTYSSYNHPNASYYIFNKYIDNYRTTAYVFPISQVQLYGYQKLNTGYEFQRSFNKTILPIFNYISPTPPPLGSVDTRMPIKNIKQLDTKPITYVNYTFEFPNQYFVLDHMCDGTGFHVVIGSNSQPYSIQTSYWERGTTSTALSPYYKNIGIYSTTFEDYGINIPLVNMIWQYYSSPGNSPESPSHGTTYFYSENLIGIRPTIYIR